LANNENNNFEIIRLLFTQILRLAPEFNIIFLVASDASTGESTLFHLATKMVGFDLVTGTSIRNWEKLTVADVVKQSLLTFSDIGVFS
jgi:hypothetical protein